MSDHSKYFNRLLVAVFAFLILIGNKQLADAAESGRQTYLLGFRSSLSGIVPPPGVYIQNDKYFYSGSADRSQEFEIGGRIFGEVEGKAFFDIYTATWVAPRKVLGGNLGLGLTVPIGWTEVSAALEILTPLGTTLAPSKTEDVTGFGDLYFSGMLGWNRGNWHWNANLGISAPTGVYDVNKIADLGFNHWAFDLGAAFTYLNPANGLEISIAPGITLNTENPATNYKNGNELHIEFAALKHTNRQFAFGLTGYHYEQLSGDSGSGALLGPFKGRVTAIGPIATAEFKIRQTPVSANIRWMREFNAKRRVEGDTFFATFAIPLGGRDQ